MRSLETSCIPGDVAEMISPLLFLQSEQVAWPPFWTAIGAALLVILTGVTTWFFSRPKTRSEIHRFNVEANKAEIDTVLAVAREFPVLLKQIEIAQQKSLGDEREKFEKDTEIHALKLELKNCLEGGPCAELKKAILAIMADVEPMIQAIERTDLLERFNTMKEKLT